VRVTWAISDPQQRQPTVLREYFNQNPNFALQLWTGIQIQAAGADASLAMGMAANDGPDIFHGEARHAVSQGLVYSLAEWIGRDGYLADGTPKLRPDGTLDRNGRIDPDEVRWPDWLDLPEAVRQAATIDGEPWALPLGSGTFVGILFSRSRLEAAGLDPMHPPKSWDEFVRWCRLLYNYDRRSPAVAMPSDSWVAAPFLATTGDSVLVQERTSPSTGKVYVFGEQEPYLVAYDTGENLSEAPVVWRTNINGKGSLALTQLYHQLRWAPWIRDALSGEPIELSEKNIADGYVYYADRRIQFNPTDVIIGCVFPPIEGLVTERLGRDIALYPLYGSDLTQFAHIINPEDLGMLPFPGMTEDHKPVLQNSIVYAMIGKDVVRRGGNTEEERKAFRDFVWGLMKRVCSQQARDEQLRQQVAAGQARFLNPNDLRRLGFDDYVKESPPDYRQLWDQIANGEIRLVLEPFMGRWVLFRSSWEREVLDIVLRPAGRNFDYHQALNRLQLDADSGLMFDWPQETIDRHRPLARVIATLFAVAIAFLLILFSRNMLRRKPSRSGVYRGFLPWVMLIPAIILLAMWSYYPLLRGVYMALQDYQIGGESAFVGLDNFIKVFLDPNFYHYIRTTFRFVFWSVILSFVTPIILALFLTEIPRAQMFFRTLFFLPQMTSGLVVTLMWKEMYMGTADGTINRLFSFLFGWLGFEPVDWLGNPATVMACVIIPVVWMGAGLSSMIYQAALKSVPDELYEAANLDGAGLIGKIRHVTLPTIMPLILINFVGAFIATFQGMATIFLLTFGGPGKETMVMAMAIWQEAYVNLRFSIATTYACVLGVALIGFTYMQLQILNRVDFRQAKGD
jgi:multiple sugar transport system permease protein